MPSEPNPKMDDLLRAYARARREEAGPPLELDPGQRRRLQEEVARTFRPSAEGRGASLFEATFLWRRLLLGGGCVAALVVAAGVWLNWNQAREAQLASAKTRNLDLFAGSEAERVPAAVDERNPILDRVRSFELRGSGPAQSERPAALAKDVARPAEADAAPAAPPSSKAEVALSERANDQLEEIASNAPRFSLALPPQPAAAPPAEAQEPVTRGMSPGRPMSRGEPRSELADQGSVSPVVTTAAASSQASQPALYFQQADTRTRVRRNFNSPPPPNVLPEFELQRAGENVRIVDADGSVYSGNVQVRAQQIKVAASSSEPVGEPFTFRVEGTNQTLQQRVVFTGEFEPANLPVAVTTVAPAQQESLAREAAPAAGRQGLAAGAAQSRAVPGQAIQAGQSQLGPGRIQGQAAVGNEKNQIRIEAQQVVPSGARIQSDNRE